MKIITLIFISLNIILLFLGYKAINTHTFQQIDDSIYSKITNNYMNAILKKDYKIKDNTILLKIDKKFFDKMGVTTSTFHRGYYAQLLKKLQDYGVQNITFDVYFGTLKYKTGNNLLQKIYNKSLKIFDKELAKNIKENVVLGVIPYSGDNSLKALLPDKKFLNKTSWIGHVQSHVNESDINDGVYPYLIYKNKKILPLGYVAYLNKLYLNGKINKNIKIKIVKSNNIFKPDTLKIQTSKYIFKIPLSKDSEGKNYIFTPLFKNISGIKSYSIYDIIMDKDNIYKDIFIGKNIFIGATDPTLNDIKLSYIGNIPGVLYHINQFLSIVNKKYFYIAPNMLSFIILVFIFIISYIFVIAFKEEFLSIIVFIFSIILLTVSFYYLFLYAGILIPLGTIVIIFFIKLLLDLLNILFINQKRKEFVTNLFKKYVGEEVLRKNEENKGKGISERKNIVMMFTDIASFTNISEKLEAQEVIDMLNIYFKRLSFIIEKTNGYIDKYIGDAIMAFWDKNIDNVDNIIYGIIQIQKIHPKILEDIKEKLGKNINIFTRIGLHYGEAIVGDVGKDNDFQSKANYTAIGDNVNLASRLEGINKYYGTCIMMSESFYKKIEKKEEYAIRLVDKITVKGKSQPVKIYEAMPYYTHEITHELISYIKEFEEMLNFYFKGNFKKALELVEKLQVLNIGKKDKVLNLYFERLKTLIENPPENWTGVWKFTTK